MVAETTKRRKLMKANTLYLAIVSLLVIIIATLLGACKPPTSTTEDIDLTLPPESCNEKVVVEYNCWTSKFPESPSGRTDVTCEFAVKCCKTTVQGWTYLYEQAAGPRGVAGGDAIVTKVSCGDTPLLLDLDGDGTPNSSDPDPAGTDDFKWD
jgi:hypothetical protein